MLSLDRTMNTKSCRREHVFVSHKTNIAIETMLVEYGMTRIYLSSDAY